MAINSKSITIKIFKIILIYNTFSPINLKVELDSTLEYMFIYNNKILSGRFKLM